MISSFQYIAKNGQIVLVLGLIGGLVFQGLASAMRPWLSELVMLLLAFSALRIGFSDAVKVLGQMKETLLIVFVYQVIFPLIGVGFFIFFGLGETVIAMVITMVLASPSITGVTNFAIMLGHRPEPTFRVLVLGTFCLPITIIPVLWFLPAAGSLNEVLWFSIELTTLMGLSIALGFIFRAVLIPELSSDRKMVLDGGSTVLLAVIVVGLMSSIAPTFDENPKALMFWLLVAFSVNYGLQLITHMIFRMVGVGSQDASIAIVAGNRNVAIFLMATAVSDSEEFLIFLSCYQVPMYLTPILMRWMYKRNRGN